MPDYSTNEPRGWCGDPKRGAALGRPSVHIWKAMEFIGKLTLRRSYLDCDGYDSNGTYFGGGAPLYWCANENNTIDFMLRASDRQGARAQVLEKYPQATVRR